VILPVFSFAQGMIDGFLNEINARLVPVDASGRRVGRLLQA
jgi:hypothetical protein